MPAGGGDWCGTSSLFSFQASPSQPARARSRTGRIVAARPLAVARLPHTSRQRSAGGRSSGMLHRLPSAPPPSTCAPIRMAHAETSDGPVQRSDRTKTVQYWPGALTGRRRDAIDVFTVREEVGR